MSQNQTPPAVCDVLIVGAGPVGVALANLLGTWGVDTVLLDRHQGVLQVPRGVHLDGETLRIIQSMGLAHEALAVLRQGSVMQWVNADNELLLERRAITGLGPQGWHNNNYYHQPQLEAALRAGLPRFAHVHVHEGWTLRDLSPLDEGVRAHCVATADEAQSHHIEARYVVGCDGARSQVRARLSGDDYETLDQPQAWLVVDGLVHHPLDLPEWSVQHCDPARPATSIFVNALRRRWELMVLPGEDGEALLQEARLWSLLAPWVKPTQATLERAAIYTFHARLARCWQRDRILIAGDAAHQTPPFLGQGLCAGLRDASNLAWKLAHALQHPATAARILATYGPERMPHARAFVQLAVDVGQVIQELDPAKAAERDARMRQEGLSFAFPSPVLGPGVHRARDSAPAVGQVAPQFEMADGRWSDDCAPQQWSLWVHPDAQVTPAVCEQAQAMGMAVLMADRAPMQAWLRDQQAVAAILRPDRYVYDLCADGGALHGALTACREDWS